MDPRNGGVNQHDRALGGPTDQDLWSQQRQDLTATADSQLDEV
jgi:hypothetical protein